MILAGYRLADLLRWLCQLDDLFCPSDTYDPELQEKGLAAQSVIVLQ